MSETSPRVSSVPLRPVDLSRLCQGLHLSIGATARLCGVSKRQLGYWTDMGLIEQSGSSPAKRSYGWPAIEKVCLIKQGKDGGLSLEGAVAQADAFLARNGDGLVLSANEIAIIRSVLAHAEEAKGGP